ncbi:MAG: RNA methyltransferase [Bacteroidales bacterium]|nr:RNA methyltransferase [Bacteroidales bacterium]
MKFEKRDRDFILAHLQQMISEDRWQKFHDIISQRTRYITVILEDIFQPHNASAVIRTCELMGIQDLHIIENRNPYLVNRDIVVGSDKWINIHKHNRHDQNTLSCFRQLKNKGFRIVATTPHKSDVLITELPVDQKIALVLGNEGHGLSETALKNADTFVKIPMYGFTESFNISVSAAICLYELTARLRNETSGWQLSSEEKDLLLLDYALKTIKNPRTFMRRMKMELENRLD